MDTDARKIDDKALFELRKRAVRMVLEEGIPRLRVARMLGVTRQSVEKWVKAFTQGGVEALTPKRSGAKPGTRSKLSDDQASWIAEAIAEKTPDEFKLPYPLWTTQAVADLVRERYGVVVSRQTVGRWLRKWGFVRRRPGRRALERDDDEIDHWKEEVYPQIAREASAENAVIFFADETGARSDQLAPVTGFSPKGRAAQRRVSGKRFGLNVIVAIALSGAIRWSVFFGTLKSAVFIAFLKRLIRSADGRKVYLVVDNHSVHCSRQVREWVDEHQRSIRLVFLPPYAPESNPEEYLNNDLKTALGHLPSPRLREELERNVRARLRSHQRSPRRVQNFFSHSAVAFVHQQTNIYASP